MDPILDVKGLKTYFYTDDGIVKSVDGVDFSVGKGEIIGIVGESGCGKSVTSLSIMRLFQSPPGKIVEGSVTFNGQDLVKVPESRMRQIRGNEISMIFQEPMTSLNPVFTIGEQIEETIRLHTNLGRKASRERATQLLKRVGIPGAAEILKEYPHRLSGGMRQRVMIAMAVACNPKLLIADEPTTALDVTIQAQILDLMREIQQELNTSIILITHDLGVVAEICSRVIVMYAGRVVEEADVFTLFENPKHPYTQGLLKSIPKLTERKDRLDSIPGNVPAPHAMPKGCKFAPRCAFATEACWNGEPDLLSISEDGTPHQVRCWLYEQETVPGEHTQTSSS
jgi:oligopeptide/dipeptide ABC transporter ATP-binding protein